MSFIALVAAAASSPPTSPAVAAHDAPAIYVAPPQTKDRLNREAMEKLVGDAAKYLDKGAFSVARDSFEKQLLTIQADPARSSLTGDMLLAFGVLAYGAAQGSSAEQAIAADYVRRAVGFYRSAQAKPEDLALALHTLSILLTNLSPADPPTEADAAIEEAYRIRLATFGPQNAETAFNLADAADLQGKPSRTRGDPARIGAAAARFQEAVRLEAAALARQPFDFIYIRFMFARFYARNHMPVQARAVSDEFQREFGPRIQKEAAICQNVADKLWRLSNTLRESHADSDADAVLGQAATLNRRCPE